jgi:hypothetical protein
MSKLMSLSIDLSKLDKSKIVEGKNGAKYYNLTIELKDEKDQYGNDLSSWTTLSKEEREAKTNRTYLGNGKVVYTSNNEATNYNTESKVTTLVEQANELPF